MNNDIKVDFDPKTKRLVMTSGFHMVDVLRSFPSRRFDPKTKAWKMPLVRANIRCLQGFGQRVDFKLTPAATQAIEDLEKLTSKPIYVPFPYEYFDNKKIRPMDHQHQMLDRAWSVETFALFAAMGTGKTFVTVTTSMARHQYKGLNYLIVVCPETLRRTWVREFNKWGDPTKFTVRYHRTNDPGVKDWLDEDRRKLHILLVSVEGLGISEKLYTSLQPFLSRATPADTMIVVDESSRIKNPDAKRTERVIELGGYAKYKMILNGTPIAKGIHDLWSQYQFLDPNIIGTGDYWAFKTRYVIMGGYENKQIVGYQNVPELMDQIAPYSLEVNKDVLKLPPKLYKTEYVEPTPEQRRLFQKVLTGVGTDGHKISVKNVLERMLRLQQIVGGFEPRTNDEDETTTVPLAVNPKMDLLLATIEDHYVGSKFIIWARYIPEIETIAATLRKKYGTDAVVTYYGGTSAEDRASAEDRYCNDPTCRILVGNPSAAGLGLTLIGGEVDVMVYYSGTFAYIDRAQSEDRCHRIGQSNTVPIIDFVMEGSLDEAIQAAIKEKTDMDQFVKNWIAKGSSLEALMTPALDTPTEA